MGIPWDKYLKLEEFKALKRMVFVGTAYFRKSPYGYGHEFLKYTEFCGWETLSVNRSTTWFEAVRIPNDLETGWK